MVFYTKHLTHIVLVSIVDPYSLNTLADRAGIPGKSDKRSPESGLIVNKNRGYRWSW